MIAYVTFRFKGEGLYLHKEDLDDGISQSAIRIVIRASISHTQRVALDNKYVICEGTFMALKHGHNDDFANDALVKITSILAWR